MLRRVVEKIERFKALGTSYNFHVAPDNYVYVCRDDGVFHDGEGHDNNGYATFVGKYNFADFLYGFKEE